jgi:hypothetical protein
MMLWLLFASATIYLCRQIIHENPIDVTSADMLPVIREMNQRFMQGHWHNVYNKIPAIWNGVQPIYLPAMWMPYLPAVALKIDMRWVTVLSLLFAFTSFLFVLRRGTRRPFNIILLLTGLLLWSWIILGDEMHALISLSEEGVVIVYMVLLVLAILSDRILLIAVAASLCMLSRYALIGWIPAFVVYLAMTKNLKKALVFCLASICMLIFLFLLPFGVQPLMRLTGVPEQYVAFSQLVWRDNPAVFTNSLGFAKYFIPGNMMLLHHLLIGLTFTIPLAFSIICTYLRKRKNLCNIPLATLKMSLVIFYNFIDVPYLYLFYTSSFVSLVSVAFLINAERETVLSESGD